MPPKQKSGWAIGFYELDRSGPDRQEVRTPVVAWSPDLCCGMVSRPCHLVDRRSPRAFDRWRTQGAGDLRSGLRRGRETRAEHAKAGWALAAAGSAAVGCRPW